MNQNMANQLLWSGGIVSAIIGLLMIIIYMAGKGEQIKADSEESKCQKSFLITTWTVFIIFAAVIFVVTNFMPSKEGIRGAFASSVIGFFIPVFMASIEAIALKKWQEDKPVMLFSFTAIPMGTIGISLLYIGFVAIFYGIKAVNLWVAFIIGAALGLYLIRLASNMVNNRRYEDIASRIELNILLVISTISCTIMAGYHFPTHIINVYVPFILLMSLYLVTLLCSLPFTIKKDTNITNIISSQLVIFLVLFLSFLVFLVHRLNLKVDYTYPIICGAVTGVIFIVMLHSSSATIKGVDLSNGAFAVLLLLGGIWSSYKWGLGLGMTLYSMGLLSIGSVLVPQCSLESRIVPQGDPEKRKQLPIQPPEKDILLEGNDGQDQKKSQKVKENQDKTNLYDPTRESILSWPKLFSRGVVLAGLATILLGMFRIVVQPSSLLEYGIDITAGDVTIAFLLGIFIPLFFEGFNLGGPGIFINSKCEKLPGNLLRFFAALFILSAAIVVTGLLFKLDGLAAFLLGLTVPSLLAVFTFFSQKVNRGLYRASNWALWIAAPALTFFLIKFRDLPDKLTRANKQHIVIISILLVIVLFFLSQFFNRKKEQEA